MKKLLLLGIVGTFLLLGAEAIAKKPTVQSAINKAEFGDVVKVKPGMHAEFLILKDGVDLLLFKNSEILGVTDNGDMVSCDISGRGKIRNPNGPGVLVSNASTRLEITLDSVIALSGSAIKVLAGNVMFTGNLWSDAGSGIWLEGGEATVYGNSTSNGAAGISVFQDAILTLYGNSTATEFGSHGAEVGMGGTLRAYDGTIQTLRDSRNRSALAIYGNSKAFLGNVVLLKTHIEGYGIQGNFESDTVYVTNVSSNGGIAFGVLVIGDYHRF